MFQMVHLKMYLYYAGIVLLELYQSEVVFTFTVNEYGGLCKVQRAAALDKLVYVFRNLHGE